MSNKNILGIPKILSYNFNLILCIRIIYKIDTEVVINL